MDDPNDPQLEGCISEEKKKGIRNYIIENGITHINSSDDKIVCSCCGLSSSPTDLLSVDQVMEILDCKDSRENEELECYNCKTLLTATFEINIKTKRSY